MWNLLGVVAVIAYSVGIWKFWQGYKRTNFQPGVTNRLMLAILWPVLVITNKSYRQNFQKALKGR